LNQKPDAIPYYPEGVRLINHGKNYIRYKTICYR
jgi:hypothetical protein